MDSSNHPNPIQLTRIRSEIRSSSTKATSYGSFSISSDSYPHPPSTFQSPPPHHHHHRHLFNPEKFGLSAALSDDPHRLGSRKSGPRVITPATRQGDAAANFHRSAPVNIPVWPKNYGERYSKRLDLEDDGEVDGGEEKEMVPPHVIVARSHVTFSVFEGAGRTLKGRDLRRVRNTVFQKTGFID
ncbi:hypothetical protein PHJA_002935500 [Phtheirospermum japonicum]|uniref:Uncharacterized protein n=1 Tax=Phtheirospermum japonicum TaxID=374723 RepID=A0A830DIA7_9LAMI|nr:hypothetical protein PHJA_002935500 [Phtheirospermum japonicum]